MKRSNDGSLGGWLREEQTTLWATIICPIIATIFTVLAFFKDFKWLSFSFGNSSYITLIYFLQAVFVCISFCYIWGRKKSIVDKLKQEKDSLKEYFQKECHIGDEEELLLDDRFEIVRSTVSKFYYGWMAVWVIWLFYYGVMFIENFISSDNSNDFLRTYNLFIFRCGAELVCSIVVFYIFLTLNNVTVAKEYREEESSVDFRLGTVFLMLCMILIGAFLLRSTFFSEAKYAFSTMLLTSVFLGAFSTLAFVLMLGKLNSYYLQIPVVLNFIVYAYAIIQIFSPLSLLAEGWGEIQNNFVITTISVNSGDCLKDDCVYNRFTISTSEYTDAIKEHLNIISIVFHLLTLIGKLCLALVLYWTAYNSRFLYFVVTKSLALTETPEKLRIFWKYIKK